MIVDISGRRIYQILVACNVRRDCGILISEVKVGEVENPGLVAVGPDCETLRIVSIYV